MRASGVYCRENRHAIDGGDERSRRIEEGSSGCAHAKKVVPEWNGSWPGGAENAEFRRRKVLRDVKHAARSHSMLMYLIGTVRRATSGSDSGYAYRRVAMNVTECALRVHGAASATSNPELSSSWRNSAYR